MYKTKELIIETKNLGFGFVKKENILRNVSLRVEKGSIYGFLGPNGAGKTTTIRLLLGLLKTPGDQVKLFGKNLAEQRTEILCKTGSLIEHPSLYEHLSGYDNLEITRLVRKIPKKKIADVLYWMDLSAAAGKKVSEYSMGMKQRLGIAVALLGDPELLIMDEPVNGLDPNGIVETRELLRNLNKESGVTIFLSSHLLSEIEKLVSHIGIINNGEVLFQGTISDLRELHKDRFCLHIETSDNHKAHGLLHRQFHVQNGGRELTVTYSTGEQVAAIIKCLVENEINIYRVYEEEKDLEQLFLGMTKKHDVSPVWPVATSLHNPDQIQLNPSI